MEPVELSAEGLLLRAWQPEDAMVIHRACQDPLIQRWTNIPVPYLPEHATLLINRLAPEGWRTGTSALFGVFEPMTEVLLGAHGLVHLDQAAGVAEMGTWTVPWARNRRVAERATRAVARWALDVLDLRQLVWRVELGNHVSRLVAERVGFVFDAPARGLIVGRNHDLSDGWRGTLRPGEIRSAPTPWLAPDGPGARRAKVFSAPQPRVPAGAATLRALAIADIEPMILACSDPMSVQWTNVAVPFTHAEAEASVRVFAPRRWARGEGAVFAIADGTDRFAGRIDLHISWEDPLIGSIGFLVSPEARGLGLATAAVRALCEWGFAALGLARIEWQAHTGNDASLRVAQKAGFTSEGTHRAGSEQRGERRDAWCAALLPADLG
ncbi:MAG: GNAT family N-acetyltransferase [Dactylosporangium sp.]|nr:GNAT family N-acetyltransferase [Dactylosporangium sp.]NNJ61399.1 GNAT family N-acetyltransferase [Dactylosporangium sp.]